MKNIIIATRKSKLALIQTQLAINELEHNGFKADVLEVSTKGDLDRKSPLNKIGGNGLFVREIEKALLEKRADIAVHSAKDLPCKTADGLVIGAVLKAAASEDCLVKLKGKALSDKCIIATGSARRICEGKRMFPDACFCDVRGNVDTRLEKLKRGEFDAIILAKAGLDRLSFDMSEFDVSVLDKRNFIPAPCQGMIAIECRSDDEKSLRALKMISNKNSRLRFDAERYMLCLLQADCSTAVGIHADIQGESITITAMLSGKKATISGKYENYRELCALLKEELNG